MFMQPLFRTTCRCLSLSSKLLKSHYDALRITPKATQAEVKAAYYRLSKEYHPDRNKDSSDNISKFRDISEAYEVLGNVKLRRLYDKGMSFIGTGYVRKDDSHEDFDDPATRFYRSREHRSRPPPPTGRTPIYDFDEWAKNHYGATFNRDMEIQRNRQMRRKIQEVTRDDIKLEKVLILMGIFVTMMIYLSGENYDKETFKKNDEVMQSLKKN